MFCKNCGNPIRDGERFCRSCGTAVNGQTASAPFAPMYMQKPKGLVTCAWFAPAAIVLTWVLNGLFTSVGNWIFRMPVSPGTFFGILQSLVTSYLPVLLGAAITVGLYFAAFSKQPKAYRTAAFFSVAASSVVGWVLNPIGGVISNSCMWLVQIGRLSYRGYSWLLLAFGALTALASAVATYFLVREYYKRLEIILQNRDK